MSKTPIISKTTPKKTHNRRYTSREDDHDSDYIGTFSARTNSPYSSDRTPYVPNNPKNKTKYSKLAKSKELTSKGTNEPNTPTTPTTNGSKNAEFTTDGPWRDLKTSRLETNPEVKKDFKGWGIFGKLYRVGDKNQSFHEHDIETQDNIIRAVLMDRNG